jgi:hypothetical protein
MLHRKYRLPLIGINPLLETQAENSRSQGGMGRKKKGRPSYQ